MHIFIPLLSLWYCLLLTSLAAASDVEVFTHRLSQSSSTLEIWTTPPSERVFRDTVPPSVTESSVKVYAAKNEYEPFQLVVRPSTSENISVTMEDFGAGITAELYQVKYINIAKASDNLGRTGPYPDPLWPIDNGAEITVDAGRNSSFWISLKVASSTPAGEYTASLRINDIVIPVKLHVFNFTLPEEIHVKSQMNYSHQTILDAYSVTGTGSEYWMYVEKIKQFFIDHRLTPKGVNWPGGVSGGGTFLEPFIYYNCAGTLSDPHGIWGFEQLAKRYIDGTGLLSGKMGSPFNDGVGFPTFMAGSFAHNDPSKDQRPDTFCGQARSNNDWVQSGNWNTPYNTKWKQYVKAFTDYLKNLGYLDKTYHYIANEPQDQQDYDAVAWYAHLVKQEIPELKLMVSEEPRPEIYDHPIYQGAKIDIWLPVLNNYSPEISHSREQNHNEETWIYFLHGTRPPFFNPITLDHPGIESKLTGWFLWKYRIKGIAYYSLNSWSNNPWQEPMSQAHNGDRFMLYPPSESNTPIAYGTNKHRFVPSIRFELMRDSLEDYEYFYTLNNSRQPEIDTSNPADPQVDKIITGLTSYTRNSEFMYNLRRLIGMKLGGEIATIPDIKPPPLHPRAQGAPGNYYINFQDPAGSPTITPLLVDAHEYLKIGWNPYDQKLGYGWYGDLSHVKYLYLGDIAGINTLQESIIYDDWGRQKTFEFDLPNGSYDVTVWVGRHGRTYHHNKIDIESTPFIDDEPSSPYIIRTKRVIIADNKLTMSMGIFDEYTMLNALSIEASGPDTAPPVLTLLGSNPFTWKLGASPYIDMGAHGVDNVDGDISNDIIIDSTEVDVHSPGTYRVYYSVSDTAGNSSEATRTVVVKELEDPNILLLLPKKKSD